MFFRDKFHEIKKHQGLQVDPKPKLMLPTHMDEAVLWKAFRTGDERAFVIVFDMFSKPMYNYGYKVYPDTNIVKDAIQELFIELWRSKAKLGDTPSIKNYLYKSLRRKLGKIKQKPGPAFDIRSIIDNYNSSSPSYEFTLIAEQSNQELRNQITSLLNQLTKRQREAVFLRYYEEMDYDKISSIMELSKQAVYNLINKAIEHLRILALENHFKKN